MRARPCVLQRGLRFLPATRPSADRVLEPIRRRATGSHGGPSSSQPRMLHAAGVCYGHGVGLDPIQRTYYSRSRVSTVGGRQRDRSMRIGSTRPSGVPRLDGDPGSDPRRQCLLVDRHVLLWALPARALHLAVEMRRLRDPPLPPCAARADRPRPVPCVVVSASDQVAARTVGLNER